MLRNGGHPAGDRECATALAGAKRWARSHPGGSILVGLSGRGDKDMSTLQRTLIDCGCVSRRNRAMSGRERISGAIRAANARGGPRSSGL